LVVGWLVSWEDHTRKTGATQRERRPRRERASKSRRCCPPNDKSPTCNLLDLDICKYVKYAHTTRPSRDREGRMQSRCLLHTQCRQPALFGVRKCLTDMMCLPFFRNPNLYRTTKGRCRNLEARWGESLLQLELEGCRGKSSAKNNSLTAPSSSALCCRLSHHECNTTICAPLTYKTACANPHQFQTRFPLRPPSRPLTTAVKDALSDSN
jgi:hypothetical protein